MENSSTINDPTMNERNMYVDRVRSKISSGVQALLKQFRDRIGMLTSVICILTLVVLFILIVIGVNSSSNKDIYYTVIQYITIAIFFLSMLACYLVHRSSFLLKKSINNPPSENSKWYDG